MAAASVVRANRKDSSELVMRCLSLKTMGAIKSYDDGAAAEHGQEFRSFQETEFLKTISFVRVNFHVSRREGLGR